MRKFSALGLIGAAGLATSAGAQVIAGADDATNAGVWGYNLATNTWTQMAVGMGTPTSPWGLAADEANSRLYWLSGTQFGYFPYGASPGTLDAPVTIGTITNAVGGASLSCVGLAYSPVTGMLYVVRNISPESIFEVDPVTGVATEVLNPGITTFDFGGFDYNPADGFFYATSDSAGTSGIGMYRIDLSTDVITFVTPYPTTTGSGTDIDGLAVGGGKAWFIHDQAGEFGVWDFATAMFETPIPSIFIADELFSAGAYAPGIFPSFQFDVGVSISPSATQIIGLGSPLTYTVSVNNIGTDALTGVTVVVDLDDEVTYVSDTGGGNNVGGTVTFNIGNMVAGSNATFTISTTADVAGIANTTAVVTVNETDANLNNNDDDAVTEVIDAANLPEITAIFTEIASSPTSQVPGAPLGDLFESMDRPYRSPDGLRWIISANSTASASFDDVVITGMGATGSAIVLEGDPAAFAPGFIVGIMDRNMGIDDAGNVGMVVDTDATTSVDQHVAIGDPDGLVSFAQEGVSSVPGFPDELIGSTLDFGGLINTEALAAAYRTSVTTGPLPTTQDSFAVVNNTVVLQEGVTVPGNQANGGTAAWDVFDPEDFYASADGAHWICQGDTLAASTEDDVLVYDGNVVIQEGHILDGDLFLDPVANIVEPYMFVATGEWMARGNNANTSEDWVVLNGNVIATTDDDIGIGTGETWDDTAFSDTFFVMQLNSAGEVVLGGTTSNADPERDAVVVHICPDGTVTEMMRQGDPVDVDGNGFFDDGAFVDTFNNDDAFIGEDGFYYFTADLQASVGGAAIGQAFLRVPLPSCAVACPADLSGSSDPNDPNYGVPDGTVDSSDFFYYLDQFVANNLAVADLSGSSDPNDPTYGVPDGTIDSSDFFYYLDQFVLPCP